MRDTVELLEALGRDSTLRHASPAALAKALEAEGASAGLVELAGGGDPSSLSRELGITQMHVEHMSQTGGFEGEEDDPRHRPDDDGDESDDDNDDDGASSR